MVVAVQVGPDGGVCIQVCAPARIAECRTFPARDDNRLALQPIAHLRERMPHITAIEFGQLVHGLGQTSGLLGQVSSSKLPKAFPAVSTSFAVCFAVSVTRRRACPRATVG